MTRRILLLVVMLGGPVAGFWFGGAPTRGVSMLTVVVAAACVLGADLLGPPEKTSGRIVTAVLAGVLFALGYSLGLQELGRATTEVTARGEELRRALDQHYDTWSEYPESLSRLDFAVPGRRLLRGHLIDYRRTTLGYRMTFEDMFGRYEATDREGFHPVR